MPATKKYPQEVRDRAVRTVNEKLTAEPALAVSTVCRLVGDQIGINKNTLKKWVKQNHIDSGGAAGMTTVTVALVRCRSGRSRRTSHLSQRSSAAEQGQVGWGIVEVLGVSRG